MSDEVINPIFAITPDFVRQAFDAYEFAGEKSQKISVGQQQAIDINGQTQDGT